MSGSTPAAYLGHSMLLKAQDLAAMLLLSPARPQLQVLGTAPKAATPVPGRTLVDSATKLGSTGVPSGPVAAASSGGWDEVGDVHVSQTDGQTGAMGRQGQASWGAGRAGFVRGENCEQESSEAAGRLHPKRSMW